MGWRAFSYSDAFGLRWAFKSKVKPRISSIDKSCSQNCNPTISLSTRYVLVQVRSQCAWVVHIVAGRHELGPRPSMAATFEKPDLALFLASKDLGMRRVCCDLASLYYSIQSS